MKIGAHPSANTALSPTVGRRGRQRWGQPVDCSVVQTPAQGGQGDELGGKNLHPRVLAHPMGNRMGLTVGHLHGHHRLGDVWTRAGFGMKTSVGP